MDGDAPDIELIEPDRGDSARFPAESVQVGGASWARAALLAAGCLVLGAVVGAMWFGEDEKGVLPTPAVDGENDPALATTQGPVSTLELPTTVRSPASTTVPATSESRVRLLPGSVGLDGEFALAGFARHGRDQPIWVVGPGRSTTRLGIPLLPGDWPHYLLFTGGFIAFTSPPDALLLGADLNEQAAPVVPARYLIPGETPGTVWAVNNAISAVTPIDMDTGLAGEEVPLGEGVNWVVAAVADGFVVNPADDTFDGLAFWTAAAPLAPIDLPSNQSDFHAGAGDTIVLVSPGPRISALNITTGSFVEVFIDIGDGLVSDVCLSPGQRYAVVVGSTGRSVVVDFHNAEVAAQLSGAEQFNSVGWTSETQLVYVVAGQLIAIDVVEQIRHEIAELDDETDWVIAGSAAMC